MGKRAFLMQSVQSYELEDVASCYDDSAQMSLISRGGTRIPLVSQGTFGRTESKTMQAPGDDDPDPEDEGCY